MKKYKVGDRVWLASYSSPRLVSETCPICYGKRQVILILGNDDTVTLPCEYCGKGFDGPRGYVNRYKYVAEVNHITIDSVEIIETRDGETREYRADNRCADIEDIFDTEEEAISRCEIKKQEAEHERMTRTEFIKVNVKQSFSWNAGYHLREAKRKESELEYHKNAAVFCKAKARGKD